MSAFMRTRERDNISTINVTSVKIDGPMSSYFPTAFKVIGPITIAVKRGFREVIEDVDGSRDSDNPCYHFVEEWGPHSKIPYKVYWTDYDGSPSGIAIEGELVCPANNVTNVDPVYLLSSVQLRHHPDTTPTEDRWDIPNYSSEGWQAIYPVIREQLASLNSIYELKDFARLPQLLRNTRRSVRSLSEIADGMRWFNRKAMRGELHYLTQLGKPLDPDTWSAILGMRTRAFKKLSIREILERLVSSGKVIPEHFLNWKFALEPLLRDRAALLGAATNSAQQLKSLLERAGLDTVHKSHWARYIDATEIVESQYLNDETTPWLGSGSYRIRREFSEDPKYVFTARYSYAYSPEAREFASELASLDALGIHFSFRNIWNAIPWSFAADWFVRIGQRLDALTPHHLEPYVVLYGSCHSLKYVYREALEHSPWRAAIGTDSRIRFEVTPAVTLTRTQSAYIRKNVVPLVTLPKTSDFSSLEKLLALALGLSSIPYRTL